MLWAFSRDGKRVFRWPYVLTAQSDEPCVSERTNFFFFSSSFPSSENPFLLHGLFDHRLATLSATNTHQGFGPVAIHQQ